VTLGESFTARDERGPFFLASFDIAKHTLILYFGDLRTLEGGLGEGVSDYRELGDLLLEGFNELVVDGVLD
jgi:hypothetical protein